VLDRFGHEPLVEEPKGCAAMDLQRSARVVRLELGLCEGREEGMDAEPASVLQLRDQEVRVLERLEDRGRVGLLEHAVAQARGEVAEHRRSQQEQP
jgi:hypothetical protein